MSRAYRTILRRHRTKNVPNVMNFTTEVVDNLIWFDFIGRSDHLLENGIILALVSHSLHFRRCGVKEIHARPQHAFESGAVRKGFLLDIVLASRLVRICFSSFIELDGFPRCCRP